MMRRIIEIYEKKDKERINEMEEMEERVEKKKVEIKIYIKRIEKKKINDFE